MVARYVERLARPATTGAPVAGVQRAAVVAAAAVGARRRPARRASASELTPCAASRFVKPGGPEVLRLAERPDPVPAAGEVLIDVVAAGRQPARRAAAAGRLPAAARRQRHSRASRWRARRGRRAGRATDGASGEAVCALVAGGGYATRCVAPAPQCLPVPAGSTLVRPAALPETCLHGLDQRVRPRRAAAGETALFHGGTSGIGTTAIQMAAARGARVMATAGSDEKCRACVALGAEHAINYRTTDFVAAVARADRRARRRPDPRHRGRLLRAPEPGGAGARRPAGADRPDGGGAEATGGSPPGPRPAADAHRVDAAGRAASREKGASRPRSCARSGRSSRRGACCRRVAATFPLAEAAAAHRLMESSEHIGKIVLTAR